MALLHVNATGDFWQPRRGGEADAPHALTRLLAQSPPDQPVPILIHGFRYAPGVPGKDPHDQILSPDGQPQHGLPSWPRHLGLREHDPTPMIAFGWQAAGTLWTARRETVRAGRALARLITDIRRISPGRRVSVMAHSLGARVLYEALAHLGPDDIWRAVLLFPATFRHETNRALATPAGQACEFVNITSGENRLFDMTHALMISGVQGRPLGRNEPAHHGRWINLPIDCDSTLGRLARAGFAIGPRQRRVCHWSSYLRPGVFALYRALIVERAALPLTALGATSTPNPEPHIPRPRMPLRAAG